MKKQFSMVSVVRMPAGYSGRVRRTVSKVLFIAVAMIFCATPVSASAEDVLKIGGVGSALGTMKLLATAFEESHHGIRVQILPSLGSTGGIKAALEGAADIGLSSRPLREEERGKGAVQQEYARTPFVFVTNGKNTVSGLSVKELVDIYQGKKQAWPDGTRIRLVMRPESDIDTVIMKGISPEMSYAVQLALSRPGMIMAITNQESDSTVEKLSGSLGVSTLAEIISERRTSKVLFLNGVQPAVKALERGTYPLSKPFYFITASRPSPLVQQFISFVYSAAGRKILSENGNLVPGDRSGHGK